MVVHRGWALNSAHQRIVAWALVSTALSWMSLAHANGSADWMLVVTEHCRQPRVTLDAPPGGGRTLGLRSLFCRLTDGGVAARALSRRLGMSTGAGVGSGAGTGPGSSWAALP